MKLDIDVLPKAQQDLWKKLATLPIVQKFYLAGGTAVALHFRHRESIDFDFFSSEVVPINSIVNELKTIGTLEITFTDSHSLIALVENVKVSFFSYPYPHLENTQDFLGIKIAQLSDLAVMKLVAVAQRGTKKDFVDVHEFLEAGWNLEAFFELTDKKMKSANYNKVHYLKSLVYFKDAESDPMPKMLKVRSWKKIKARITTEVRKIIV